VIHVDLDPAEIGRNYPARLGIVGDARTVLRQIREEIERQEPVEYRTENNRRLRRPELAAEVQEAVHSHLTALEQTKGQEILPMFRQLREVLPPDTLLSLDSQIGIWALRFLPAHQPRVMHFPAGLGTLGYGLPAAIGMKVGCPHRPVVCITGDGGFMLSCQEMGTVVQEKLGIPIVICNDGGYGSIRWHQRVRFGGRYIGVDLDQPDFVAFAESFGAAAIRLNSPAELPEAVAGALTAGRPVLIEVPLKVEPPRAR
jgi:acetolactate synthase I/II/III large subunit